MLARNSIPVYAKCGKYSIGQVKCSSTFRTTINHAFRKQSHYQSRSKNRAFSTMGASSGTSSSDSPVRVSQLVGALIIFGIGATSWGLYEFYTTLTMWPKEIRGELRAGLRAKHRGDMKLSRRHLTKAWEIIQTMTLDSLSPDPYLKFSGVAVVLAEVLEAEQELDEAFSVLQTALVAFTDSADTTSVSSGSQSGEMIPTSDLSSLSTSDTNTNPSWSILSPPGASLRALLDSRSTTVKSRLNSKARMRAVALALKLGDLAETLHRPQEEERWLSFAVTEVLRLISDEYGLVHNVPHGFQPVSGMSTTTDIQNGGGTNGEQAPEGIHRHETDVRNILSPDAQDEELGLPTWVTLSKTELAAPMERLGAFYARRGKYTDAILLYRVASSLLVRSKPNSASSGRNLPSTVAELCQALQIENAHMALMMDLHRKRPENVTVQRDLPRILLRAVNIYNEARWRHGLGRPRDDGVAVESEISLCEETYPAVLYNAGVYYEEKGQLEQALHSYALSYKALRTHGSREMMYEALENARRLQRIIDKNKKIAPETSASSDTSPEANPASETLEKPARQ